MSGLPFASRTRFFESQRSARVFIVGLNGFYLAWGLGVVSILTGWTWLVAFVALGCVAGSTAVFFALRMWELGFRDRCAVRRQLRDASCVAEWDHRRVATLTYSLLVVDGVSFLVLWLLAVGRQS